MNFREEKDSFFKYDLVLITDNSAINKKDTEKLLKMAKKLANNCYEGDEDHHLWIVEKFGSVKKNTSAIFFLYEKVKNKEDVFKKNYSSGFVVKKLRLFGLTGFGKIKTPVMCSEKEKEELPISWRSGKDILDITVRRQSYSDIAKWNVRKVFFCNSNVKEAQLFFSFNFCAIFFQNQQFIMNSYKTMKNYEFFKNMGAVDLDIKFSSNTKVLLKFRNILLELPVNSPYINLGKKSIDCIKSMVMYPEIENYYIENERLITDKVKQKIRPLDVAYTKAEKKTGFYYSLSANFFALKFSKVQAKINFKADFEALTQAQPKDTTFTTFMKTVYNSNEKITFGKQPKIFMTIESDPDPINEEAKKATNLSKNLDTTETSSLQRVMLTIVSKFSTTYSTFYTYLTTAFTSSGGGGSGGGSSPAAVATAAVATAPTISTPLAASASAPATPLAASASAPATPLAASASAPTTPPAAASVVSLTASASLPTTPPAAASVVSLTASASAPATPPAASASAPATPPAASASAPVTPPAASASLPATPPTTPPTASASLPTTPPAAPASAPTTPPAAPASAPATPPPSTSAAPPIPPSTTSASAPPTTPPATPPATPPPFLPLYSQPLLPPRLLPQTPTLELGAVPPLLNTDTCGSPYKFPISSSFDREPYSSPTSDIELSEVVYNNNKMFKHLVGEQLPNKSFFKCFEVYFLWLGISYSYREIEKDFKTKNNINNINYSIEDLFFEFKEFLESDNLKNIIEIKIGLSRRQVFYNFYKKYINIEFGIIAENGTDKVFDNNLDDNLCCVILIKDSSDLYSIGYHKDTNNNNNYLFDATNIKRINSRRGSQAAQRISPPQSSHTNSCGSPYEFPKSSSLRRVPYDSPTSDIELSKVVYNNNKIFKHSVGEQLPNKSFFKCFEVYFLWLGIYYPDIEQNFTLVYDINYLFYNFTEFLISENLKNIIKNKINLTDTDEFNNFYKKYIKIEFGIITENGTDEFYDISLLNSLCCVVLVKESSGLYSIGYHKDTNNNNNYLFDATKIKKEK
jgi:hypothetical protein